MIPSTNFPAPFALPVGAYADFAGELATLRERQHRSIAVHSNQTDPKGETWREYCQKEADDAVGLRVDKLAGIAVQPVIGVMVAGCHPYWEAAGCCFNTSRIEDSARIVSNDPTIKVLVLDFDSPGGYTQGVQEAAEALGILAGLRPDMKVIAYASGMCCSAAIWVAMGCPVRFAAPSAEVGSIGTYIIAADTSKYYSMKGIDVRLYTDGKYKALGADGVEWPQEWHDYLQARVDDVSASFKGAVRAAAPSTTEDMMQGQSWPAKKGPVGEGHLFRSTEFRTLDDLLAAAMSP